MTSWLSRIGMIERNELPALAWSFLYFFSLLSCYFILRPLRDTMGIAGGIHNLPWLFTATFITMLAVVPLYGWLVSRFERRQFIPYVYVFFSANLLIFWLSLTQGIAIELVARIFFVWISVFNIFVISVFWSFMIDIWRPDQTKRLFGIIAAGGTTGTIVGPAITAFLSAPLGIENLYLISAGLLFLAIVCVHKLSHLATDQTSIPRNADRIGGGMFDGIDEIVKSGYLRKISSFIILLSLTGTIAYFQQAELVRDAFASNEERTQAFALVDLSVSIITLFLQLFVVGRIMTLIGVRFAIIILPLITVLGFILLSLYPTVGVILIYQVLRRAAEYGTFSPARENLFSILPREEKYKAKNFIDTVVFRGGDAASGWLFNMLSQGFALGTSAIALIAIPIGVIWAALGWSLGKEHATKNPDAKQTD